jgi:mannose/fructose-specific phosphotransferase system component IIA
MTEPLLPAILVTHGKVGEALVAAAEAIVGPLAGVDVLSNDGLSRDSLVAALRERMARFGPRGGVVLVDIAGGSCAQAALAVAAREAPGPCPVLTGVNLPMLLDFAHHRTDLEAPRLAERLLAKAQAGVTLLPGAPRPAGPPA